MDVNVDIFTCLKYLFKIISVHCLLDHNMNGFFFPDLNIINEFRRNKL